MKFEKIEITLEKPCDYFVGLMTAGVFYPMIEGK